MPYFSPRVNQTLALIRERLRDPKFPKFVRELEVFTNKTEVQINAPERDPPVARSFTTGWARLWRSLIRPRMALFE